MLLLATQNKFGQRWFERLISGLLLIIVIGFVAGLFLSPPDWGGVLGGLVPRFQDRQSVLLAASMLGATVMPHAVYLHSGLSRDRFGTSLPAPRIRRILSGTKVDVLLALLVAGSVNVAMLVLAASALRGVPGTETITGAHDAITHALGPVVGIVFAIGLLASGLASTSVGAYAGAAIMDGLLHVNFSLLLRRAITIIPALIILGIGFDPTLALVLSQVVLSLGIPFAIVPLVTYTSSRGLMGAFVNQSWMRWVGWIVSGLIIALNIALVVLICMGEDV